MPALTKSNRIDELYGSMGRHLEEYLWARLHAGDSSQDRDAVVTGASARLPAGAERITPKAKTKAAPRSDKVRGRVLIVDDEPAIRAMMKRMLGGHDVVESATGKGAKKTLAHDQAFDVVLCDMMMPVVSGMDLHAWLMETKPRG